MYHDFLNALQTTVAQCMGDEWGVEQARAWNTRIAGLLDEIHAVEPVPA
jgi:hypothetical protein